MMTLSYAAVSLASQIGEDIILPAARTCPSDQDPQCMGHTRVIFVSCGSGAAGGMASRNIGKMSALDRTASQVFRPVKPEVRAGP